MDTSTPDIVTRYLAAADARDSRACADCFTPDGTVVDEGETFHGPKEIFEWRKDRLATYTYTTTIDGTEPGDGGDYLVRVTVQGDFPGGTAQLIFRFTLRDGLIAALRIA